MARPPSPDIQARNLELIADVKSGMSPSDAALKYGVSRSMVSQLLRLSTQTEEEIPEDTRARLIHISNRALEIAFEVAEGPGRAITSGAGTHVYDAITGQPAYDPSPKLDALRQIDAHSTKLAKLTAAEKQPPKVNAEEVPGWQQSIEIMAETQKENKNLKQLIVQLQAQVRLLENSEPAQIVE